MAVHHIVQISEGGLHRSLILPLHPLTSIMLPKFNRLFALLALCLFTYLGCTTQNNEPADNNPVTPIPATKEITVASFNVKFLFDTTCNSGACGSDDFERLNTQEQMDAEIARVRNAVRVLDADVLVFQEVETEALLEEVMEPFRDKYPTLVFGNTGSSRLDVGIVTKGQLLQVEKYKDMPLTSPLGSRTSFAREFLEVHSDFDGLRVIAFGAHFISKFSSGTDDRREAEGIQAAQLMSYTGKLYNKGLVVLGGDLNDTPDSPTLAPFYKAGVKSASAGLSIDEFYTASFQGNRQSIDYVLYWGRKDVELLPESVRAFHDEGRSGYEGSDHAAVRATFRVTVPSVAK